jgi:hypothetical protein
MTFRQLGWRQLAEAQEAKAVSGLRTFRGMGEVLTAIQNADRKQVQDAAATEQVADPLAKYDVATVLLYGIVKWTYPEKLNGESIQDLDEATATWAATEIVNLGKPATEAEAEDAFFGSRDSSMASPMTMTVATKATSESNPNGSSL